MGLRGKHAKPKETLLATGSKHAKYDRANEPEPPASSFDPPIGMHSRAVAVWDQVAPMLLACGTLKDTDRLALSRYCEMVVEYRVLVATVLETGSVAMDDKGNAKIAPESKHIQTIAGNLLRLEQHFGMTPASRPNIHVEKNDGDAGGVLGRLLNRGKN